MSGRDRFPIVAAAIGSIAFLLAGVWAMAAPESFFEQLARFEPYNQHFIQDIGAFQIGLGIVLLIAAIRPRTDGLTVALLGAGSGAAAHAVSHLIGRDLGGKPATDIPFFIAIALLLLVAGVLRGRSASG